MKVLELFAGTRSIGRAFEARWHEVYSVEWDKSFGNIDLYEDILKVQYTDILREFGRPDVIWASPDCSSYSIAAISHHRRKDDHGNLTPVSEYAKFCDRVNQHVLCLMLALSPRYWFIENPRGGAAQNGFHERVAALHDHILPVRRYEDETDRYMVESSEPAVFAAMPQRRPMPRPSAARRESRNAGAERLRRTFKNPAAFLRTHRGNLRGMKRRGEQ